MQSLSNSSGSIKIHFESPDGIVFHPVRVEAVPGRDDIKRLVICQSVSHEVLIQILLTLSEGDDDTIGSPAHAERIRSGPELLRQTEVAKHLRCSETTVKRMRFNGELDYKPGKPVLITRDAVLNYIHKIGVEYTRANNLLNKIARRLEPAPPPKKRYEPAEARRRIRLRNAGDIMKRAPLTNEEKERRAADVKMHREAREKAALKAKAARKTAAAELHHANKSPSDSS